MPINQSINETTFFINENNKFVLNILKKVLGIPLDSAYTMRSDNDESSFFTIYDEHNRSNTSFSAEYYGTLKEFHLSMEHVIYPFEGYNFNDYLYTCNVVLDSNLNYLRTEVAFHAADYDADMLIFIEDGSGISVSYLSPPLIFEEFILTSKNFMTHLFNDEAVFLTELYVKNPAIFNNYTMTELFEARTDTVLLTSMKQVSDMAII
jgi:hypothetical protein